MSSSQSHGQRRAFRVRTPQLASGSWVAVVVDDPASAQAAFELMARRVDITEIEVALERGEWASLGELLGRVRQAAGDRQRSSITGTLRR